MLDTLREKLEFYGFVRKRIEELKAREKKNDAVLAELRETIALALNLLKEIRIEQKYGTHGDMETFKESVFGDWLDKTKAKERREENAEE